MENETKNTRNKIAINSVGLNIIMFFLGCVAMFALIKNYPTTITENVTKLEKDVTVTDTGIADAV